MYIMMIFQVDQEDEMIKELQLCNEVLSKSTDGLSQATQDNVRKTKALCEVSTGQE